MCDFSLAWHISAVFVFFVVRHATSQTREKRGLLALTLDVLCIGGPPEIRALPSDCQEPRGANGLHEMKPDDNVAPRDGGCQTLL